MSDLPQFSRVNPSKIEQQLDQLLSEGRQAISAIKKTEAYTWESVAYPLQVSLKKLSEFFSPISHLNAVKNTPDLRKAYEACLPKLSAFYTEFGQDAGLFKAFKSLESTALSPRQKRWVALQLQDLKLSGVDLPADKQVAFKAHQMRLSTLGQQFNNHVLDATNHYSLHIENKNELEGIPEANLQLFKQKAEALKKPGYCLTIDQPSVHAVLTYADNRALRKTLYLAANTKASDQSDEEPSFDNSPIIEEILKLKLASAKLLGFNTYAEQSLATKMAESPEAVLTFLHKLATQAKPFGEKEVMTLKAFAKKSLGIDDLSAWDFSYVSEKYREKHYALSEETLRQYFPADRVLEGLFTLVNRLFGVTFKEQTAFDTYHEDVRLFELIKEGNTIAFCYLDLYARAGKKPGAWMSYVKGRFQYQDGKLQLPIAFLTMNFRQASGDQPALLSHSEVTTLFHEFGHGLHHMLTQVAIIGIAGIDGVEWDAVELPSQLLENWCYEPEVLAMISAHVDTGEPPPQSLLDALLKAKLFNQGYAMLRQLEFALFDLNVHSLDPAPDAKAVQALLEAVRQEVSVLIPPAQIRFQNSFSHIFAGGYAAGYFSYKWAEVLSSDVFSKFEAHGIFDEATAKSFYDEILSQGASRPMSEAFFAFMGRKPDTAALLKHAGLTP